jgi:RNA 2',3'-cyclic 3'-phosphodiesterase
VRLFVALNVPAAVRAAVWEAAQPLRDAGYPVRWVRPEGIHLTLKFLGGVDASRESEMIAALGRARSGAKPLPLVVGEFGVFPDFRRPRVLWAGVTPDPALELLQHGVEREFAPLGFPPEGRAFRPHITLGRAARDATARDFPGLEAALAATTVSAATVVESVDLMHSEPQSGGAVYHVRHREPLD